MESTKTLIWTGPRYKIELTDEGYQVVQLDNNGRQPLTANAISGCVSIKQAHYLANHGITKIG